MEVIVPQSLRPGDSIAIVSPAGAVREEFVAGAAAEIERRGYRVRIGSHALGSWNSFSAPAEKRLEDFADAWMDPDVKAVWCARGGFGAVQLLGALDCLPLRENAKWLIGYSDVCALHALLHSKGIASLHAPMARHLTLEGGGDCCTTAVFEVLEGGKGGFSFGPHPLNRCGEARGVVTGGNLAVLTALLGTSFNVFRPGQILFIEDIAEPAYKVERMLWSLRYAGVLDSLAGLIVGAFTDCRANAAGESIYDVVSRLTAGASYPVAFCAPLGHTPANMPVVESVRYRLSVRTAGVVVEREV